MELKSNVTYVLVLVAIIGFIGYVGYAEAQGVILVGSPKQFNISVHSFYIPIGHEVQAIVFDGWVPQENIAITQLGITSTVAGTDNWTINLTRDGSSLTVSAVLQGNHTFNITDITDTSFTSSERIGINVTSASPKATQRPAGMNILMYYYEV